MPRFHFHTADGAPYRDKEGVELPDLAAARDMALRIYVELLPTAQGEIWEAKLFSLTAKDETGRIVAMLTTTAVYDPLAQADLPPQA